MIQNIVLLAALLFPAPGGHLKDVLSAVGQVQAGDKDGSGETQARVEGSGVVISSDGIVVTNYHVISSGTKPFSSIYFNLVDPEHPYSPPDRSRLYRAQVLLRNPAYDLALLRLVADAEGRPVLPFQTFKAVPLGNSRSLNFLDEIHAVGFPKAGGSTITVTRGQVSGKEELEEWIKTDAQVTHGSSGGAAVDRQGRLIGIPTKVRPDIQPMDTDHDGFPDAHVTFGSVGLIRPVELVAEMLEHLQSRKPLAEEQVIEPVRLEVKCLVVNSESDSVGDALVGLLKFGSREATLKNLLTYARADASGTLQFPLTIPPGKYTIRARAEGYDIYLEDIELTRENRNLVIKLKSIN